MPNINKIVLAYSGGLDTSVILNWLKNTYKDDGGQCPPTLTYFQLLKSCV